MPPGFISFDDLQFKLLFYEQRLNYLNYKKGRTLPIHQAFAATIGDAQGFGGAQGNSNQKGNCNNHNKCGYGCNNRNNNKNASSQNSQSEQTTFRSSLAGTILFNAVVSSFSCFICFCH